MNKVFGYYNKRADARHCEGDHAYNCEFGIWREYQSMQLAGAVPGLGDKKFTILNNAKLFACGLGKDFQL